MIFEEVQRMKIESLLLLNYRKIKSIRLVIRCSRLQVEYITWIRKVLLRQKSKSKIRISNFWREGRPILNHLCVFLLVYIPLPVCQSWSMLVHVSD